MTNKPIKRKKNIAPPKKRVRPEVLAWVSNNRNTLTEIAHRDDIDVSPQFVSMILSGKRIGAKSKGELVRLALVSAGAPL